MDDSNLNLEVEKNRNRSDEGYELSILSYKHREAKKNFIISSEKHISPSC